MDKNGPLWATSKEATAAVTEKEWGRTVVNLFRVYGWKVFRDNVAWRSDPGYPDMTCFHAGQKRVVWVELKREAGKTTANQEEWLSAIRAAGQEAYVLRPSDWELATRIVQRRVEVS